jgi:hypothetical protein
MTEAQFRQWLAYTFEQSATGVAKTGVLSGLGVTPTTPSPSGSVVVGKGAAVCQPSSQAFPLVEPADETFDVFTANPMQFVNNPRNDIIVLDQVTGLVTNLVGTPNVTPSSGEQSVPATAVPLWRLRHAANATTIPATVMDDLRVPTGMARQDAGWATLSTTGFPGTVVNTIKYRILNGVVYMQGNVQSFTAGTFVTLCTLPVGARPSVASNFGVSSNTAGAMVISVATTGVVTLWCEATTTAFTGLANVIFPVG